MSTLPNVAMVVCVCFPVIAGIGLHHAEAQSLSSLVTFEAGDLPIILSAPHGGNEVIPGVPPRRGIGVSAYGSGTGGTMDAIQLEVGKDLRAPAVRPAVAEKMATAIASFAKEYLPREEQRGQQNRQPPTRQSFVTTEMQSHRKNSSVFTDSFTDSKRDGWFEMDDDSSTLSVKSSNGQLGSPSELNFSAADESSLKAFAAHFDEVTLHQTGDFVTLRFDARHDNSGFINRGFRFGLFHSGGTRFTADDDQDSKPVSLDDRGYFVMLDLGVSTTADSAVIRETNNFTDERLMNGGQVAFDAPDSTRDPLIFTREKNYAYSLTLTRNSQGSVDVSLKNHVTGDDDALTGTSKLSPTHAFDTIYFGVMGSTANFAIDNVSITDNRTPSNPAADKNINIGVYVDEGAGPSVNDLLFVLSKYEDVSIKRLTARAIESGQLEGLDLLIQSTGIEGQEPSRLRSTIWADNFCEPKNGRCQFTTHRDHS